MDEGAGGETGRKRQYHGAAIRGAAVRGKTRLPVWEDSTPEGTGASGQIPL